MAFPVGWGSKHKITIDNTKVSGSSDLTNFPVLLTEDNFLADAFTNSDNGGGDIRFSSDEAGSTQLSCEIVSWDTSGSTAQVWVKIPTLSYNSDTVFYVWYNNTGQSQPARDAAFGSDAVWTDYEGVYHMEGNFNDSSPNAYNLTNSGATSTSSGKIGGAYDFEDADPDSASIADASSPNQELTGNQTYQAWIKPESLNTASETRTIVSRSAASTKHLSVVESGGNTVARIFIPGLSDTLKDSSTALSAGTWYFINGIYDGSNITIGVNTTFASDASTGTATDVNGSTYIGAQSSNQEFDGLIDEVRIAGVGRSNDWLTTEYNNQNSPSTFATASAATILKDIIQSGFIAVPR